MQDELKHQQLKQELETKQQGDESKFLIENTGAVPKRRNSPKQMRERIVPQEENCKSLEIEGEKHDIKSEKSVKCLTEK